MRLAKNVVWPDVPPQAGPVWTYLRALVATLMGMYARLRAEIGDGKTGTLTLDDGANWRVVTTYRDGRLVNVTITGSTAATAVWSE